MKFKNIGLKKCLIEATPPLLVGWFVSQVLVFSQTAELNILRSLGILAFIYLAFSFIFLSFILVLKLLAKYNKIEIEE